MPPRRAFYDTLTEEEKKSKTPATDRLAKIIAQRSREHQSRGITLPKSDVLVVEHVVETVGRDPRPNAFFDHDMKMVRVYHGPYYGNPFDTLIPRDPNALVGTPVRNAPQNSSYSGFSSLPQYPEGLGPNITNNAQPPQQGPAMQSPAKQFAAHQTPPQQFSGPQFPQQFPHQQGPGQPYAQFPGQMLFPPGQFPQGYPGFLPGQFPAGQFPAAGQFPPGQTPPGSSQLPPFPQMGGPGAAPNPVPNLANAAQQPGNNGASARGDNSIAQTSKPSPVPVAGPFPTTFGATAPPTALDTPATPNTFAATTSPAAWGASSSHAALGTPAAPNAFAATSSPAAWGDTAPPAAPNAFAATTSPAAWGAISSPAAVDNNGASAWGSGNNGEAGGENNTPSSNHSKKPSDSSVRATLEKFGVGYVMPLPAAKKTTFTPSPLNQVQNAKASSSKAAKSPFETLVSNNKDPFLPVDTTATAGSWGAGDDTNANTAADVGAEASGGDTWGGGDMAGGGDTWGGGDTADATADSGGGGGWGGTEAAPDTGAAAVPLGSTPAAIVLPAGNRITSPPKAAGGW